MKLVHAFIGAAMLVGAGALSAYAAGQGGLWNTLPQAAGALTGNELIPADTQLPGGAQPQTEYISVIQLRGLTYSQQVPLTGFNIVVPAGTNFLQLNPAGTLATGTIVFPPGTADGQQFCIYDTQTQTAVTLTPATGNTIAATIPTALTAATRLCWAFAASTANATTANQWIRTQ
jgi:hypothetical protein